MISNLRKLLKGLTKTLKKSCIALIFIFLIGVILLIILPETIINHSAPLLVAGFDCQLKNLDWHSNGASLYDSEFSYNGDTVKINRISLLWKTKVDSNDYLSVFVKGINLSLDNAKTKAAISTNELPANTKVEKAEAQWWQTYKPPVDTEIIFENLNLNWQDINYQKPLELISKGKIWLDSDSLTNRFAINASFKDNHKATLNLNATQLSNDFSLYIDLANIPLDDCFLITELLNQSKIKTQDAIINLTAITDFKANQLTNTFNNSELIISLEDFNLSLADVEAEACNLILNINNIETINWPFASGDMPKKILESWAADASIKVGQVTWQDFVTTNSTFAFSLENQAFYFLNNQINLFDGQIKPFVKIMRKKVKDLDKYLFAYNISCELENINAGQVCDAFDLMNNRIDGHFSGSLDTYIFGNWVKRFDGSIDSLDSGILYFPESKKYIQSMEDGLQKQLVEVMTERLMQYPYQSCNLILDYDRPTHTTKFNFIFKGAKDKSTFSFPIEIHTSWLEALKLIKQFQN